MLTEITYDVKTPATLNLHDHGLVELELADPTQFNLHQVVRYADFHIQPLHIINNTLSGLLQEEAELPVQAEASQAQIPQHPEQVANALHVYWSQFWDRDAPHEVSCPSVWNEPNYPTTNTLAKCSYRHFRCFHVASSVEHHQSGKARGYDGWYVDDLKALPDTCLQTLAHIFQQRYTKEPFPPSLMQIITLPMGKNIILEHNQKLDQSLYSHNLSPASQSGV